MGGLIKNEVAEPEIRNGGFINEALTEMLTQQMYPNSNAYEPQVRMMTFANLLSGKVNNYSLFLKGNIDAKGYGAANWNNFVSNAKAYQIKWSEKGFHLAKAINDELYIKAQRDLIESKISQHRIASFEEYTIKLNILMQRPAPDTEFIDKFIDTMDNFLISNLGLKNTSLKNDLINKLKEYREIYKSIISYKNNDVYEFEIAGFKVAIDKDRNLYGYTGGYSTSWDSQTGICTIKIRDEEVKLDIKKIDFENWGNRQKEKQKEISKYFSATSKYDIKAVSQFAGKDGLERIEKFILPAVGNIKSMMMTIYVAIYNDRIEILGNPARLDNVENIYLAEYIGVTSLDPKVGAIYANPLGTLEKGIVFANLSKENLVNKMLYEKSEQLLLTLTPEQISIIVKQYKQSDEFNLEDNLSQKELQNFATKYYLENKYHNMSKQEQKDMLHSFVKEQKQFVISSINGKIEVSTLFDGEIRTAFKGKSEVLFDNKGKGLYNDVISLLSNKEEKKQVTDLPISSNGELIIEEELKPKSDFLKECNEQLAALKSKYGEVAKQIKDLMQQNAINPIQNYQNRLNDLIQQRDLISKEMEPVIHRQRTFQQEEEAEKEQAHKIIISQVEKLIGIRITDTAGMAVDSNVFGGVPQTLAKDTLTLRYEEEYINKVLEEMYHENQLDVRTYQKMKVAIIKEYEKFIRRAPKPIKHRSNMPTKTINTEQSNTSQSTTQTSTSGRVEVTDYFDELRRKHGYFEMSEMEQIEFDKRLEKKGQQAEQVEPIERID